MILNSDEVCLSRLGLKTKENGKEPNKEKKQKPRFSDEIASGLGLGIPFRFVNENWFQGSAAAGFKFSENLLSTWPLIDS